MNVTLRQQCKGNTASIHLSFLSFQCFNVAILLHGSTVVLLHWILEGVKPDTNKIA